MRFLSHFLAQKVYIVPEMALKPVHKVNAKLSHLLIPRSCEKLVMMLSIDMFGSLQKCFRIRRGLIFVYITIRQSLVERHMDNAKSTLRLFNS